MKRFNKSPFGFRSLVSTSSTALQHASSVTLCATPSPAGEGNSTVAFRDFGCAAYRWRKQEENGLARSPTKAIPDQGLYPSSIPQKPVPCHSERAFTRVELLRRAAKALWALAPCGIWDGLLGCIFVPRDLVGHFVLAALPRVGFDSQNTAPWCFARSR